MSLYDSIRHLPLHIDGYYLEPLEREVAREFTLKRTVVVLHGRGEEGRGEDVDYDPHVQEAFQADEGKLPFAGEHTLESFSLLQSGQAEYRRWGIESAALDLALRQAGLSLGEAIGREPKELRFVVSTRTANVPGWLGLYPELRFKLDPTPEWTDEVLSTLAGRGNVDVIDLKGQYKGTVVDNPADPELYRRIAEAFPDAWLEDPDLETEEARRALLAHQDRITWDAPIHSVEDILNAPVLPRTVNLKPSRFGSLKALFEAYEFCEQRGMGAYGGGQYELGVGRGHVQLLAALFHPNAPNDIAPGGYDALDPEPGLPESPLNVEPAPLGFRRAVD